MNRKEILDQLYKSYSNECSDTVILYGSKYVGINSLVESFLKNKNAFVYKSRICDSNTQFSILSKEIIESLKKRDALKRSDFETVFRLLLNEENEKKIIVFDDFTSIIKSNKTFLSLIFSLIRDPQINNKVMILFVSEDINYIENEMSKDIGDSVFEVNRVLKAEALRPSEIIKNYKNLSFSDYITYYSIIGGNSDLWKCVRAEYSTKDFICDHLLNRENNFYFLGNDILPNDLREKSVYNTLLYLLANGNTKLNELHNLCGYDRAKISVYLKNLSKRGLVEKCSSTDIGNSQYEKKGIYRISDVFCRFWFRYVYSYESLMRSMSSDKFYKKYIEPTFNVFREDAYRDFVMDYLNNDTKTFGGYTFSVYYDKDDSIDIIGVSKEGDVVLCATRYAQPHMAYSSLDKILNYVAKSGIKYDKIFLFSAVDFDQKLHLYSSVHENVKLIKYIG